MNKTELIASVNELDLSPCEYVVIGSGILCALELRDADDIDLVVSESTFEVYDKNPDWKRKYFDDGTHYLVNGLFEIGFDWDSEGARPNLAELKKDEVVIANIPFISPERCINWKRKKGRKKDNEDIRLLEEHMGRM